MQPTVPDPKGFPPLMGEARLTTAHCAICDSLLTEYEAHICGLCEDNIMSKEDTHEIRYGI